MNPATPITRSSLASTAFHSVRWFAGLLAGTTVLGSSSAFAATWTGATSTDWNNSANWSGAFSGSFNINSIPTNVATISTTISPVPTTILVGLSAPGQVNHVGGTATVSAGQDLVLGRTGAGNGIYNLANTGQTGGALTGFGQGSGSLIIPDQIWIGGSVGAAAGTLRIHTTGTASVGTQLLVGNLGGTGTVLMDSGTLTVADDFEIGNGTNSTATVSSTGTFSMSGGTVTKTGAGTAVTIGGGVSTDGGNGTANLNGGTFTTAGVFRVGQNLVTGSTGASNGTLNLGGTALTVNGEFWVGNNTGATGTMNFTGGSLTTNNWALVGRKENANLGAGATGHVTMSGGTWTKNGESNFVVGDTGTGTMNMTGGLVIVNPHATADRGITWIGARNNANGTLTLSGTAEFRSPRFVMGVETGTFGTLNLNGGTVKTGAITGGAGDGTVNFNGTQIVATGNNEAFVDTLINANLNAGGLVVDSAGYRLTIPQGLAGSGGVVKNGAGTLSLTGTNTYTGGHVVNAGALEVSTSSPGTGDFTVANGATLGLVQAFDTSSLAVPNVTLGASGAAALDLELSEDPGNPAVAPLEVTGTLTLNGPITLNVDDAEPAVGTIPLVAYTGPKAGSGSFVAGRLPLGAIGSLSDDGSGLVSLNIVSIAFPRWEGNVDGNWDTSTANWIDPDTSGPMLYQDPLPVAFDDDATGTTAVVLNVPVAPGNVAFNNETKAYTLNGTGKISGYTGLVKTGAGSLAINTTNDYTGVTTLSGGVTTVGTLTNGGMASPLGAASASDANLMLNGGTLDYTGGAATIDRGLTVSAADSGISNANNLTLTGVIAATADGGLKKSGTGVLTLTNPSVTVGGPFQTNEVLGGTLAFTGPGQTVSIPGELYVGSAPNVPGHLTITNSNLAVANYIALGRGNGDTGTVSTLTATGSVVQAGNLSTGFDNALANDCDQTVTLTNTNWTTTGFTLLAERGGSTTTMTLAGNSAYTANNRIQMAIAGGAVCDFTIQDTASLVHSGGWFSIGNDGTATMTVKTNGSLTTNNADFNISDVGTSNGTLNIQDNATVAATGIVFVGKNAGTTGTVNISGGTFSSATYVTIGRRTGATGHFNLSGGTVNQTGAGAGFIVGENGTGTLTVSGTGTLNINGGGLYLSAEAVGTSDSRAYLNGGTIIAKRVVQRDFNAANYTEFRFNGGTLRAQTGSFADFMSGHDLVSVDAGGAFIDSNGQSITISQTLGGTGGLTKLGSGTLTLSGANTYAGNTTVSAGTLSATSAFFSNTATVTIASGAVLNLNHALTDQVASLVIGANSLPLGTYNATTHPGVITGTGSLQVTGAVASAYDTWIAGYPSIQVADRDPGDDPDGDGATNAVEFALGGTPNSGSSRPKVHSLIADSSADGDTTPELLLTIAVRSGTPAFTGNPSPTATHDGFTYTVQGSTTLGSFTTVAVPVTTVATGLPAAPAGYEYRTFSLTGSNGIPAKGFMRVGITP